MNCLPFLFISLVLLTGCAGIQPELIEELRLDACEIGEVTITGDLQIGGNPWATSSIHVDIREVQTADTLPYPCLEREAQ